MQCKDQSGFLFAHQCTEAAETECVRCGRAVCARHTRLQGAETLCIPCQREQGPPPPEAARGGDGFPVQAAGAVDPLTRDPFWFAHLHLPADQYSAADLALFDPEPDAEWHAAGFEDDFDGS